MIPDTFGCVGTTFKALNGKYIDLRNPDPESIDLDTIATGLSRQCRFNGHCPEFYSVAEHCVLAVKAAERDGVSCHELRAILLHDAAEAYLGDVIKPLKNLLPGYREIEDKFDAAIAASFGVNFDAHRDVIKQYDRMMLKVEKTTMWPDDAADWEGFSDVPTLNVRLNYWSPDTASRWFKIKAQYLRIYGSSLLG